MLKLAPDLCPKTVQIKIQNDRKKVNDKRGPVKPKERILSSGLITDIKKLIARRQLFLPAVR